MIQVWSLLSRVWQKYKHLGYKMMHERKVKETRPEVDASEQFVHHHPSEKFPQVLEAYLPKEVHVVEAKFLTLSQVTLDSLTGPLSIFTLILVLLGHPQTHRWKFCSVLGKTE